MNDVHTIEMTDRAETGLLIDGRWSTTGEWLDVASPYTGERVGRVASAGVEHAHRAVDAASAAMATPIPPFRRAEILERVAELLREHSQELARTICLEAGKPIRTARAEVQRAAATYVAAAAEARRLAGEVIPMEGAEAGAGKLAFTLRVPIGVVGAITPFNFPLNLVAHKLAPALAAGCAVVLKPAAKTPLSALRLAALQIEAGLPAGWLNVVVGPAAPIGDVLIADERVEAVTFTGSEGVGWQLAARAPQKKVLLELGNATPVIVEPDAHLARAAEKLAANAFSFAGQSCISVQRIYVHEDVREQFLALFISAVEALRLGDPTEEDTDVGPVIDSASRERILAWIEEARELGAEVLTGGTTSGPVIRPTVLADVPDEAQLACNEVFGPVCTISSYSTLAGAIARANNTRYGLQAGIFTASLEGALEAAQHLEFGGVVVNEAPTFRADQMPYGGVKASGNTREGPAYSVRELTESRLVIIQT